MADMISSMVESFGGPVLEDLGKRFGLLCMQYPDGIILRGAGGSDSGSGGALR